MQVFVGSAEDIAKKDTVARAILAENKNVVYVNVRVVESADVAGAGFRQLAAETRPARASGGYTVPRESRRTLLHSV